MKRNQLLFVKNTDGTFSSETRSLSDVDQTKVLVYYQGVPNRQVKKMDDQSLADFYQNVGGLETYNLNENS